MHRAGTLGPGILLALLSGVLGVQDSNAQGAFSQPGLAYQPGVTWLEPRGSQIVFGSFHDWVGRPARERHLRPWHRHKNPRVAMFSSFLLPGLGQLYNEREFWALVAAGVHFYFIANIIIEQRLTNHFRRIKNAEPENVRAQVLFLLHRDNRVQSSWLLGLTMLLSGAQSFVDAHLFDFQGSAPLQLEPELGSVHGAALRLHF